MTTRTRWRHSHCLVLRAQNSGMWDSGTTNHNGRRGAAAKAGRTAGDCRSDDGKMGDGWRALAKGDGPGASDIAAIFSLFSHFTLSTRRSDPKAYPACPPADCGRRRRHRQRRDRPRRPTALPPAAVSARHATPYDAAAASVNI